MSYLRFDKTVMTNLEESLPREVLRTNRSGAYSSSTITDCNTRKYHGLLVIPVPELDDENHVLLSSLDVTVVQHGVPFNLGLHKYQGNNYSPNGHKYIREFDCEKVPTTIYRVGGVILKKEILFIHHETRLLLRYTLVDAHSATTLRFRPYLAFRSVRQFTHENGVASQDYQLVDNGIKTRMYDGYPELYMQLSKKNEFHFEPDWYRNIEYPKEQERGYDTLEDLYVPGYFECPIKKGESIVFSASISEMKSNQLKRMCEAAVESRSPRNSIKHCLVNAAHQFYNLQQGEEYILAGYPWFKARARDTFIALPGLTLAVGEIDEFHTIMKTCVKAIDDFIDGKPISVKITEMEHPDILLWAMWTIQQYGKYVNYDDCVKRYGTLVEKIMEFLRNDKHPNLKVHENGLVYTNGRDKAVTWMNSSSYGRPIVPRSGYVVEINALWYNALLFSAELLESTGRKGVKKVIEELRAQAETCAKSFHDVFLNEYGYLLDYVDGAIKDWSVRPNMIFAAALDYSPLDKPEKKKVLDYCTKELLTPRGLRTLSPKSSGYNPMYTGPQSQRDYAYHMGTAWPWLEGFYLEAYLKLYQRSGLSFIDRQLVGFEDEMKLNCISTLPEMFDGNPPFRGRGAMSFAMNVAEILRIYMLLRKYKEELV